MGDYYRDTKLPQSHSQSRQEQDVIVGVLFIDLFFTIFFPAN